MRRFFTVGLFAVLAMTWFTATVNGQAGKKRGANKFIERLKAQDANGDGKITKAEAKGQLLKRFAKFDANGDGAIDQAELKKLASRFSSGRPSSRAGVPVGKQAPRFPTQIAGRQTSREVIQLPRKETGRIDFRFIHLTSLSAPGWRPGSDAKEIQRQGRILHRLHP